MIFAAVAGAAFDRSSLALELLTRARLGFSSHHTAAARQNQCVADLCYGVVLDDQLRNQGKPQRRSVLRDALARVQEALRLIDSVCREHARTGDVARYSSADDLRDWARCGLFSELSRAFFGTRQSDTLSHRLAAGDGGQRPLTALRFGYGNNPPLDHRRVFDREEVEVQGAWLVT
jgi:hypothetical protein